MKFASFPNTIIGGLLFALALPVTTRVVPQDLNLSRQNSNINTRGLDSIDSIFRHDARSVNIADDLLSKRTPPRKSPTPPPRSPSPQTFQDLVKNAGMFRGEPNTSGKIDIKPNRRVRAVMTYKASNGMMQVDWVSNKGQLAPKVIIANEYQFVTRRTPNTIRSFIFDSVHEPSSTAAAGKAMTAIGKGEGGDHLFAPGARGWTELNTGNALLALAVKVVGSTPTSVKVKDYDPDSMGDHNLEISF